MDGCYRDSYSADTFPDIHVGGCGITPDRFSLQKEKPNTIKMLPASGLATSEA